MAQLVKTVGGLAIASVKTVGGLAIASVKTVGGLDNTSSGKVSFSDSFPGADGDSLGANWTEIAGDIDIVSHEANAPITFDNTERAAAYTGTACTTVDQYCKVTLTSVNGATTRPGMIFRYTNGSTAVYDLRFDGNNNLVSWNYLATPTGAVTQIGQTSVFGVAITFPMTFGATIIGTGNATTVRIWQSPTANAPDAGGTTWDSAAPTKTLTDDPGTPVDTGPYVGIGGVGSSTALAWAAFFGGDVP